MILYCRKNIELTIALHSFIRLEQADRLTLLQFPAAATATLLTDCTQKAVREKNKQKRNSCKFVELIICKSENIY